METVFLSLSKSDFQDLIAETVNSCLKHNQSLQTPPTETNRWFNLKEFCNYHPDKPAKATVYGWVNAYTVPFYKKGKKLFFLKSEIDTWLKTGRKKTVVEIEAEADNYLSIKKAR